MKRVVDMMLKLLLVELKKCSISVIHSAVAHEEALGLIQEGLKACLEGWGAGVVKEGDVGCWGPRHTP